MFIKELLVETIEEIQELNKFSSVAAQFLAQEFKDYLKDPQSKAFIIQQIEESKTNNVVTLLIPGIKCAQIPGTSKFFTSPGMNLVKDIELLVGSFPPSKEGVYGSYYPTGPTGPMILINYGLLVNRKVGAASTIAHELQHAIDDFKSRKDINDPEKGKALGDYPTQGDQLSPEEKWLNYIKKPSEINARFTEAIKYLKDWIESEDIRYIKSKNLMTMVTEAFRITYMDKTFPKGMQDPRYKRLVSRTYSWLAAYYNDRLRTPGGVSGARAKGPGEIAHAILSLAFGPYLGKIKSFFKFPGN